MKTILIVDDEVNIRDSLAGVLSDEGFRVLTAESAEDGIESIEKEVPDLLLLDIWLPGMDGVDALKIIKERRKELPIIMISGHGSVETAVTATKFGAYDFLEKPLSLDKVVLTVEHALEQKRLAEENRDLLEQARREHKIIGKSASITGLKQTIKRVAPTNSWVLITGENGTGKELVARNIYIYSNRAQKPFITLNCASIPKEDIERELFGKEGRLEMADGGTLFLDEIGEMSLKVQEKMLKISRGESVERPGSSGHVKVDVRVLAASSKDLTRAIKGGLFIEELYERLNVIPLHVDSLRERTEDIPYFVGHYFKEFSYAIGKAIPTLSDEALEALYSYNWPGNVRELRNVIERLIIMSGSAEVTYADIPLYIRGEGSCSNEAAHIGDTSLKEARASFEKEFISKKLRDLKGNVSKTAEAIGLERSHLYRKIKAFGIKI
ncbi:MAG: sigma-54-dependent Fis family transcriptional regulator [Deltaproteobacteria bacterium]|nr:sigma-54-dependent Fis family transcriptional regulator [Deltaproteobacteria bacterium]